MLKGAHKKVLHASMSNVCIKQRETKCSTKGSVEECENVAGGMQVLKPNPYIVLKKQTNKKIAQWMGLSQG